MVDLIRQGGGLPSHTMQRKITILEEPPRILRSQAAQSRCHILLLAAGSMQVALQQGDLLSHGTPRKAATLEFLQQRLDSQKDQLQLAPTTGKE